MRLIKKNVFEWCPLNPINSKNWKIYLKRLFGAKKMFSFGSHLKRVYSAMKSRRIVWVACKREIKALQLARKLFSPRARKFSKYHLLTKLLRRFHTQRWATLCFPPPAETSPQALSAHRLPAHGMGRPWQGPSPHSVASHVPACIAPLLCPTRPPCATRYMRF